MSGSGKGKAKAGKAAAAETAALFASQDKGPALRPSSKFELVQEDLEVLNVHAVVPDGDEGSTKAGQEWRQLKQADQAAILAETRRFVVLKALAGAPTIKAAELSSAVLRPGLYGNPKSIKGPFLLQRVAEQLKARYGIQLAHATDGMTQAQYEGTNSDDRELKSISNTYVVRLAYVPLEMDDASARDPLTAARRGLLFVVLGLILAQQPDKAIGEDTLFTHLVVHFDLPEGGEGDGYRDDGLADWRNIVQKEFVHAGYLERKRFNEVSSEADMARRAQAGVASSEDKFVYRVGPKSRAIVGIPAIARFMCTASGVPMPEGKKLQVALGPESVCLDFPSEEGDGTGRGGAGGKRKRDDD